MRVFVQNGDPTNVQRDVAFLWRHINPILITNGEILMIKKQRKTNLLYINPTVFLIVFIFQLLGCSLLPKSELPPKPAYPELLSNNSNIAETNNKDKLAQTALKRNRLLWKDSKIDNYDFICTQYGGGMYPWVPVLIKVRNGRVISRKPVRKKLELERISGYENVDLVEKFFDKIQEGYDKEFKVDVTYNKELGYPESALIDNLKFTDTYVIIEITKFEIIKR